MINEKTQKLEQICDYMTSCRIAVEKPHKQHRTGDPYRVRIQVKVPPAHDLVVERGSGEDEKYLQVETIVRNAFEAMRKQLQELVEKQRGKVKKHPEQVATAIVDRIYPEDQYGFLRTIDGREIYFHA
ncbi:HPF/RaiA family ribosome-associated protein, partial [Candidatus Saccharibacteria bacterium]|nr:HPF/RaiA family ribosome-associated protein [Candidatus Saccharibacteria bacterium]NIV71484.1 HPF/RaiA family ribosome-associated protein [Calditrichia bacterium]NIV98038.1 HPF/RaiA family ribosome-associated protein [Candidatus Saccharibacteria bacterium]NIW78336.1 HPF/RaiA family ribosome-associated protein [Calditrichia bacterium]